MTKFPALPLWTDALIGDTYHLTPAEFGAYLRLLIVEWRRDDCALPNNDSYLGRAIGDPKNWHRLKDVVMAFFTLGEDGFYRQNRLLDERDYCARKTASSSAAGKASALKRLNRDSTTTQRKANEKPTPIPIPIKEKVEVLVPLLKDLALSEQSSADADAPHPKPKTLKGEPGGFSEWYEAFPKHKGRGAARRAYAAARKKTDAATLLTGAIGYAEERGGDDPRFTKMPATWLNAECWRDDAEPKTETVSVVHRERMLWLKEYARDGRWQSNKSGNGVWRDPLGIGPPPHQAGTLVTDADLELIPGAATMKTKLMLEVAQASDFYARND